MCKCPEPPSSTNVNATKRFAGFDEVSGEAGDGEKGTKKRSIYVNSLVRYLDFMLEISSPKDPIFNLQ